MSRVIARWAFNAKFGATREANASIARWCNDVGAKAWTELKWTKAQIAERVVIEQGSVGALEQRFELRIEFASLTELDGFFGAIPGKDHVKWGKDHALLMEGNTKWEIFRTKPIQWE